MCGLDLRKISKGVLAVLVAAKALPEPNLANGAFCMVIHALCIYVQHFGGF